MAYIFRKTLVTMTALLATIGGHVHGDDDYLSSSEISDNNCSSSPALCDPQSACCNTACCGRAFISADFLYLRPYQGGLTVCDPSESTDVITPGGTVNSFSRGKRHEPNFKWDPGYRVGLGYQFANCWDIAAYYMHFDSKAHRHGRDDNYFRWKLDFDVIDAVIGNEFCFGSCFTIRPYIGVRGARIDQKARSFVQDIASTITADGEHNKSRFTGIGPLAGLEINWNVGCGFGIFADSAISSLWGRYNVRFENFHTFPNGGDFSRLREHLNACELVFDSAFGISWTKCFCNNKEFVIKIGAEQHRYFNHNRIGCYGDLCLAGGFVSAGVKF